MKTGTLKRVKNISGYVKSKNGRLYTVVILVNSKAGNWKASQLQFSQKPTSAYLTKIKKLGLFYSIERKDKYKVFVGPYNFESTARKSLQKVRKHINKGAFLVSNKTNTKNKGAMLY